MGEGPLTELEPEPDDEPAPEAPPHESLGARACGEGPPQGQGIVDRIMALSRRLQRMMEKTLSDFGLTFGEWSVLAHLRRIGPPHRRSPGELARRAGLSSGAMTNRLDRLEEAGFVRRLPDPDDRRSIQVELTEDGHRVVAETIGAQAAKEAVVASALDEDERKAVNALLRRLMLALDEAGVEPKKQPEETPV